jgi:D-glycero-alpha-D-manno-heptose 1-phosphate guanylyltransferase
METIILAGGLGTRLQGVIGASPKCMAPVNGKPFLAYLFDYLNRQKCTRVILSLGYKHKMVLDWLETQDLYFELDYMVESEPLGTGGGIQAAIEEAVTDDVAVVNGDTLFLADIPEQMREHRANKASATLALKEMNDFDRYGIVNIDKTNTITDFEEKQFRKAGLINGGVYIINREAFLAKNLPEKFSFERNYLEQFVGEKKFYGYRSSGYFIDIGIPEDYARAQENFKTMFR